MDLRLGNGLDFHRLVRNPARPLVLGGRIIESDLALEGHSDADLILHALADAILGALAGPDIGELFPDTDPSLKNMDSALIIRKALDWARDRGFRLMNVDVTIIGEQPKIKPHREAIRESLARLLQLEPDRVGLKATTTERMGFLGRGEGLGCLSTALLVKE